MRDAEQLESPSCPIAPRRIFAQFCLGIVTFDGGSDLNDSIPKSDGDGVSSVKSAELANSGVDVLVNGSFGDMENLADFQSRFALRDPCQNFTLTRRE